MSRLQLLEGHDDEPVLVLPDSVPEVLAHAVLLVPESLDLLSQPLLCQRQLAFQSAFQRDCLVQPPLDLLSQPLLSLLCQQQLAFRAAAAGRSCVEL